MMATIRASERTHKHLRTLSKSLNLPIQSVLEQAVEEYRRMKFLEQLDKDFAALRADPAAWQEELEERKLWENTLSDGLDKDEKF